jgi:hypothetical protein
LHVHATWIIGDRIENLPQKKHRGQEFAGAAAQGLPLGKTGQTAQNNDKLCETVRVAKVASWD